MDDSRQQWAQETVQRLHSLPARSIVVLSLMYFSRLDEVQICAHTGWSSDVVRSAAAAGLRKLGGLLAADAVGRQQPTLL